MPDVVMGRQMRINRRVNGTFKVTPLRIGSGHRDAVATDEPDWDPVLDEFGRVRAEFLTAHPTAADYAAVVELHPDGIAPSRALTRTVTAPTRGAIVLRARPPASAPADFSTSLYLQAAGTAEAMEIEFCQPAGADIGAVAVRSVVGRPHTAPAKLDVDIVLPRSVQTISRHEAFTADEAAEMFEKFYRTDTIGDGYTLRPVEGYTADGNLIDLRGAP